MDTQDSNAFRAGFEARDARMVIDMLSPEVVLHAPVLPAPFEGREAVAEVIEALMDVFDDLRYTDDLSGPNWHLLAFRAGVHGRWVEGADLFRFDSQGKVREIQVFARPLSGTVALAAAMGPRLARRRGRAGAALVAMVARPLPPIFSLFDAAATRLLLRRKPSRARISRDRAVILYGLPGSHPTACVEAALRIKQVRHRRVDLLPVLTRPWLRRRFGRPTLPAMIVDGERVSGSRRILRRLDALYPEPALFPEDREAREQVEEAERWGEEIFQPLARRIALALARRDPEAFTSHIEGTWRSVPLGLIRPTVPLVVSVISRLHNVDDASALSDFAALGPSLTRIDRWVEDGTLGHLPPNAADLQIGASLQLLGSSADLRPFLAGRPSAGLGADYIPAARARSVGGIAEREWIDALGGRG
jgi:glutathione S-transferase